MGPPRFRAASNAKADSEFPAPGFPWSNYAVIAYCALVAVLLAITHDQGVAI